MALTVMLLPGLFRVRTKLQPEKMTHSTYNALSHTILKIII
jgi:hypothetical protein